MNRSTQEKIEQLQILEQNMQNLLVQKQTIQSQLTEIESASQEINKKPAKVFKIIGQLMVDSNIQELEKDLNSKKEISELKIKTIEKQESKIKEKIKETQEEVLKEINKND